MQQPGQAASNSSADRASAPVPLLQRGPFSPPVDSDPALQTSSLPFLLLGKCRLHAPILMGCCLPIRDVRVLFVIEWTTAAYSWNSLEVVVGRRRSGIPLECEGIPGIIARWFATAQRND